MMKKLLAAVLVLVMLMTSFTVSVGAAEEGTLLSNAVELEMDRTYFKAWTKSTDHLNHYTKFVVPTQGIVTITATKPFDEDEYGSMQFTVYNSSNIAVWDNHTYKACDDISDRYTMRVGLAPGTYYMTLLPGFSVYSGLIETYYSVSFEANSSCEIESNDTAKLATPLIQGRNVRGFVNGDYGDYEECDYFKFSVTAGHTYRVTWYDYENINGHGIYFYDPSNNDVMLSYYFQYSPSFDGQGNPYHDVTAEKSGTAYIKINSYGAYAQAEYNFSVENMTCKKTGHKYKSTVTFPTATQNGYTTFTCTVCGDSYTENYIFPDVRQGTWYYDAVEYVAREGFMSGYKNGKFGPADNLQRQDFVVALARIAGADLTAYENSTGDLKDVVKGAYYAPAVAWAVDQGIITGYQNGKFGVGDTITREQVATIFYRYVGSPEVENIDSTLSTFPDQRRISPFSRTAMAWAVQNNVVSGMQNGTLSPTTGASRAQIATIIMRMDQSGLFYI